MVLPLDLILRDASSFVKSEFNLQLEKSKLKQYSVDNWQKFCEVNGFDMTSSGLYVPASCSAYVRADSPFLVSNLFHELYGHGLFCEHSQIGKRLVDIIQNQGNEKAFLFDEVTSQEPQFGLCKQNISNYEGFAVWLEALLCQETDNSNVWQAKRDGLREDYAQLFEYFKGAEQKMSRFGLMSQLGFPKFYDDKKVLDIVKRFCGSAFSNVDFVILYGSQKPESDIDLCVISTNPSSQHFNGWLDITELNRADFQKRLENLDIALTDAMFSGRLIHGDNATFSQLKQQISDQPITTEIIQYNRAKSEKQKEYATKCNPGSRLNKLCSSYCDSFSKNAEQLSCGKKCLTLANLKQVCAA